jgi:para-aminobenzoate synthetase component 1
MHSAFTQAARTGLSGPPFLDLLHRFSNEPLAALYSGDGRGHSVIGRKPLLTLSAANEHSRLEVRSPLPQASFAVGSTPARSDLLDQFTAALVPIASHHPLTAWIGHFAYDLTRTIEPLPSIATNDHALPLLHWQLFEEYLLFDHATERWDVVLTQNGNGDDPEKRLNAMGELLADTPQGVPSAVPISSLLEAMPRDVFLRSVEKIQAYIAAGDIFQANFAQRWKVATDAHPIDLFERLMARSPSQYAALLIDFTPDGTRWAAISASPELLLQRRGTHLLTRPIKGTRPRDLVDAANDERLRTDLLHSEKDQAELAMIVDVLRNDFGHVADYGSVKVTAPRVIEALPTLWHAHSDIEATYTGVENIAPLLRALLPGGSITGAPKIRATQIIEELEPHRRGLYCGSIGTLSTHDSTLNLAIRTLQMRGNLITLHAGAGIVADSTPEHEYEETLHKAAAMLRAINAPPAI